MVQILAVACVIMFVRILKQAGVFEKIRSSSAQRYVVVVKGILAWSVVALVGWGVWNVILTFNQIIEAPLSLSAVFAFGKLVLILYGVGYAYQAIITFSESGTTQKIRASFLKMLFFQHEERQREDIFEKGEQMKMKKRIEEEQRLKQQDETQKPKDKDFEKYFGS